MVPAKAVLGTLGNTGTEPHCVLSSHGVWCAVSAVGVAPEEDGRVAQRMQEYVDLVCAEVGATRRLSQHPLQTVFFGGGTPSLVPPQLLRKILETLHSQYGIDHRAEVSMEADPGIGLDKQLCSMAEAVHLRLRGFAHAFVLEHVRKCKHQGHDINCRYL